MLRVLSCSSPTVQREKVQQLLLEPKASHAIICDDLKKLYAARDGNPVKFAVRGLSLALPPGECFGMLGPNGAGKTSFINMVSYFTICSSFALRTRFKLSSEVMYHYMHVDLQYQSCMRYNRSNYLTSSSCDDIFHASGENLS